MIFFSSNIPSGLQTDYRLLGKISCMVGYLFGKNGRASHQIYMPIAESGSFMLDASMYRHQHSFGLIKNILSRFWLLMD